MIKRQPDLVIKDPLGPISVLDCCTPAHEAKGKKHI